MQYAILQEWERRKKTTKRSEELAGQAANEKDPKKLMELIKQIEAILEARKQRRKGKVPNLLPREEPTD